MKKIVFVLLAAIFFISCTKKNNSVQVSGGGGQKSDRPVIGFSIDTLAIERWQRDLDIFIARAKELGADVIVQNAGNSTDNQNQQLLYLLEKNVDVIVVVPKEAHAVSESIEKISMHNIPVISYDRLILDTDISLYITIDSEKVGELMGRKMKNIVSPDGWSCILGPEEDFNMSMILKGLKEVCGPLSPAFRDIFYTQGWNYDLSRQRMIDLITSGNIPTAVICGNDAIADSVVSALQSYYPNKDVHVCGQDADIAACQNIVRGLQDFTIYKPISDLAVKAAEFAVKLAQGARVESLFDTSTVMDNGFAKIPTYYLEPTLVDRDNIDSVVIDSGFHTYGEVYRE